MSKIFAAISIALLGAWPCSAATLYVSGTAPSTNTACTLAAPCDSLTRINFVASAGDTVICLTPPAPGGIQILVSLTVDCTAAQAQLRDSGYVVQDSAILDVQVIIDIPVSTADPLRTVRLRGLTIDGAVRTSVEATGRKYERGIDIRSAAAVHIEDCVVANMGQHGLVDRRTGGQTKLFIKDSVFSGNVGAGILSRSSAVGITVLDNIRLENNAYGLATATGNNVFISRSTISGNTTAGVEADPGAQVNVSNSTLSHNTVHVQAYGAVRLRENDLSFSNIAVQGAAVSMGANRFSGNGSIGTAPSLASGAPADVFN